MSLRVREAREASYNGTIVPVGQVVRFEHGLQLAVESITPDRAKVLLEANVRNRRLRMPVIQQHVRALEAGDFDGLNGETLKLDSNGYIIDGQHRLEAIVRSGITALTLVVRGCDPKAWETIDTGIKRKMADVLGRRGEANAARLAAALRWTWLYENGWMLDSGNHPATHQELFRVLERHPGLRDSFPPAEKLQRAGLGGVSGGCMAAFIYLCEQADRPEAEVFFEQLATGEDLKKGNGLYELRETFVRQNSLPRERKVRAVHLAALTVKAFNIWRAGTPIKQLSWRRGGKAAEGFPTIDPAYG